MFRKTFIAMALMFVSIANATVVTFEENQLAPESYWGSANMAEDYTESYHSFTSGDAYMQLTSGAWSWSGFSYSNTTDMTDPSVVNDRSAYIAGGEGNTSGNQYGVCGLGMNWMSDYSNIPETLYLTDSNYNTTISGMWVTNTTFAYMAMSDNDVNAYATAFGGADGNSEDYFTLVINGITEEGSYSAATVEFNLADFRFEDNSQDYIIDTWTWVDLSELGDIIGLEFNLLSSDAGDYGINTPLYFAFDNLNGSPLEAPAVPEPASLIILAGGAAILSKRKNNN